MNGFGPTSTTDLFVLAVLLLVGFVALVTIADAITTRLQRWLSKS